MEYVQFGSSGLEVSKLCLGAMNFPNTCDRETAKSIFETAIEHGVNFIDTADSYRASEEVMGEVLQEHYDELVITTKVYQLPRGRPGGGRNSRLRIIKALEDSLRKLKRDHVDLYQLHHPDPITPIEETLSALDRLVQDGKVRCLGVANHYAWQAAHMLGVSALHNWEPIVSMQCRYNIFDRVIENETVPCAQRFNLATMTYGPLHGGILTGKYKRGEAAPEGSRFAGKQGEEYLTDETFDLLDELQNIADNNGMQLNQLAMKWVLSKDFVTTPIIGGSRPEHFEPMYEIFDLEVDPEDLARIDEMSEKYRYQPFGNQPVVSGPPRGLNWL